MTPGPRALGGIVLAALLLRLLIWPWFAGVEPSIHDEGDYDRIATSLAERGEFAVDGQRTSSRPPLYPALVSLVYRVAGTGDHQAVRLLQILFDAALVLVVFSIGRRLYDERTGTWAAALAAFYPSLLGHDFLLLTEVSFTLLIGLGALLLIEAAARPRLAPALGAGVVLGLAALTRSSMLLYPPLLAIVVFAFSREERARRIALVAAFVLAFGAVIGPWVVRNSLLHGRPSAIDTISSMTAVRYSPVSPHAEWQRPGAEREREREASERERARATGGGEGRPSALHRALSRVGRIGRDAVRFWRIDREIAGAASRGWLGPIPRAGVLAIAAIVAGYYVVLLVLVVFGLATRPPADRLQLAIMLSFVAVLWGVHALTVGHSRYHVPLVPLLAPFAARLLAARGVRVPVWRWAAATLVVAGLAASWAAGLLGEDRRDLQRRLGAAAAAPVDDDGAPLR